MEKRSEPFPKSTCGKENMVFLIPLFSSSGTPAEFLMVYPMKQTKSETVRTAKVKMSNGCVM